MNQKHLVRFKNLDALRRAQAELKAAEPAMRVSIIDEQSSLCSELRATLWLLGHGKCWYSDVQITENEGHVEHYRPKKKLWKAVHSGYWWRALDWTNLRLAHPITNLRMRDFVTKTMAGKGSYFPLIDEKLRASCEQEEHLEDPVLLDPVRSRDPILLTFILDTGAPSPAFSKEHHEVLHKRAMESIQYYHLNEGTWNMRRHDLMLEVSIICDKVQQIFLQGKRGSPEYLQLIGDLTEMIDPFAEFSSACQSVVRERGLLEYVTPGES